jgi:hypothetical protein
MHKLVNLITYVKRTYLIDLNQLLVQTDRKEAHMCSSKTQTQQIDSISKAYLCADYDGLGWQMQG